MSRQIPNVRYSKIFVLALAILFTSLCFPLLSFAQEVVEQKETDGTSSLSTTTTTSGNDDGEVFANQRRQEMNEIEGAFTRPEESGGLAATTITTPSSSSSSEAQAADSTTTNSPLEAAAAAAQPAVGAVEPPAPPASVAEPAPAAESIKSDIAQTDTVIAQENNNDPQQQQQPQEPEQPLSSLPSSPRPNRRTAPHDAEVLSKLPGSSTQQTTTGRENGWENAKGEETDNSGSSGSGSGGDESDDYYGLNQNAADHLDRVVFQPSHIFAFEVAAAGMTEFFEDIADNDVGIVIRGDWFVTSGDDLDMQVIIHDPNGEKVYAEGPTREDTDETGYVSSKPCSDGSFRFATRRAGTYRITFFNPSLSSVRTVTFAWLVGRDDDDPWTAKQSLGSRKDGKEIAPSRHPNAQSNSPTTEVEDGEKEASSAPSSSSGGNQNKNVTQTIMTMLHRVSTLHKSIDDITSVQQLNDVGFARHARTVTSNQRRVTYWSLGETIAVILTAIAQVMIISRFDFPRASTSAIAMGSAGIAMKMPGGRNGQINFGGIV